MLGLTLPCLTSEASTTCIALCVGQKSRSSTRPSQVTRLSRPAWQLPLRCLAARRSGFRLLQTDAVEQHRHICVLQSCLSHYSPTWMDQCCTQQCCPSEAPARSPIKSDFGQLSDPVHTVDTSAAMTAFIDVVTVMARTECAVSAANGQKALP